MREPHMYSNMMGQDSMGRNMMGQDTMGRNMIGQDTMGRNMMGRNIYSVMSNRGMTSDVSNMIGQQRNSIMMGHDHNEPQHDGSGQELSDNGPKHVGTQGNDSQYHVQQCDWPRQDGHFQQQDVIQHHE